MTALAEPAEDYEAFRRENIARNNAMLRSLGLLRDDATVGTFADLQGASDVRGDAASQKPKKRKRGPAKDTEVPRPSPSRRSRRLQGEAVEAGRFEGDAPEKKEHAEEADVHASVFAEDHRAAKLRAANEVAKAGADAAAMENPTASYDHTLHRVRTMTDKRLASRVKVIERAAGKHCVVKMAIFTMVLKDQGKPDLAELAEAALNRLMALAPAE